MYVLSGGEETEEDCGLFVRKEEALLPRSLKSQNLPEQVRRVTGDGERGLTTSAPPALTHPPPSLPSALDGRVASVEKPAFCPPFLSSRVATLVPKFSAGLRLTLAINPTCPALS